MGTMGYMAPEVLTGSSATAQSDIYSLGVVLYQMLTRYVPFHGTQTGPDGRLPELQAEPVSRIVRGVPKEVDAVLEKALAHDITARYTSAKKLAEDLEGLLRVESLPHYPRVASRPPKPRPSGGTSARIRGVFSRLTGKSRPPGRTPGADNPPDVDILT
jgi:serine/threonine-protein kinase